MAAVNLLQRDPYDSCGASSGTAKRETTKAGAGWIGASLLRKEDARHLYGHGMFIADVHVPGVQDVAFVRSPMAHARAAPSQQACAIAPARVFTLADIGPINVLEAGPELSAHRHSPYPPLADGRVRYVGQTIAACVMPTRAQAEDLADEVRVELGRIAGRRRCCCRHARRQSARFR